MLGRVTIALLAWAFLACAGAAQTLDFPTLTGRVVDEAGVLNATLQKARTHPFGSPLTHRRN